eukprot:1160142-Pelagomonas_calceolata.AAC.15
MLWDTVERENIWEYAHHTGRALPAPCAGYLCALFVGMLCFCASVKRVLCHRGRACPCKNFGIKAAARLAGPPALLVSSILYSLAPAPGAQKSGLAQNFMCVLA